MMLSTAMVRAVVAARKRWAPKTAAHKEDREVFGGEAWRAYAQRQLGIAEHRLKHGWDTLASGSVRKCLDANEVDDWEPTWDQCVEAFYDGYALGTAMHGGKPGKGRVLEGAHLARLETEAFKSASLVAEAMGPELDTLVAGYGRALAAPARKKGLAALKLAVVMGLMLHRFEFEWDHEWLEGAKAANAARKASKKAEPAPVHLPPNADLIKAVIARPDDDAPRLVYADWLMERGDPRGEFIALQLKLGRRLSGANARWKSATAVDDAEVSQLKEREVELIKRFEKVWVPRKRCFRTWAWRRGFLSSVVADFATFAKEVDSVADMPLESVQLTGFRPEHLRAVMAARAHPTVHSFNLWANRLGGATLKVLSSPLFSRARCLHLEGNDFRKPQAVAECELPRLERLSLCRTELSDEGLAVISTAPFFSKLTHLDLSSNRQLTLDGLQALRKAKALRWVSVVRANIEPDRAAIASLLPRGAQVRLIPEDPVVSLSDFASA